MNLYFFAEHDDIEEIAESLFAQIAAWAEPKTTIQAILRTDETEAHPTGHRVMDVGIELSVKKIDKLKDPLNQFYQWAKEYKCEFVVGQIEDNDYRDVCYFGFEEGRPDRFEIANYLGLEK